MAKGAFVTKGACVAKDGGTSVGTQMGGPLPASVDLDGPHWGSPRNGGLSGRGEARHPHLSPMRLLRSIRWKDSSLSLSGYTVAARDSCSCMW